MVALMEAIHPLYDQSHGHTFSAALKLLTGGPTPTVVRLVSVYTDRMGGRQVDGDGDGDSTLNSNGPFK